MSALGPAPVEPSANALQFTYLMRLAHDEAALDRAIDRYLRTQERAERRAKAAAILARRKIPGPPPKRPAA